MNGHVDILEEPDRLRGTVWASILFHVALVGLMFGIQSAGIGKRVQWGDPTGGGMGSVTVNPVNSIPLPSRAGEMNPVANDTESAVPAPPPAKTKSQPKTEPPDPKAIPLKKLKDIPPREIPPRSQPNKWAAEQKYQPNQLYTRGGQAANSPMFNLPGGGDVGVGTASPFGTQFGAYATLLRDQVARNWKTAELDARISTAPPVSVVFTIRRDGSLVSGSVKVSQTSGNRAIDYSAQRAIMDAAPFPGLPPQYNGSEAVLELQFQLRR
jgi:periplasmic protein TonB